LCYSCPSRNRDFSEEISLRDYIQKKPVFDPLRISSPIPTHLLLKDSDKN
jgi:hypothetical protein